MNKQSTNIRRFGRIILTLAVVILYLTGIVGAQEKITLKVGDQVPPLKYSKWIQGQPPITKIENDKIYVFEFWATWCGPCIQAMPHLSELSKKYKGKISFIGCDVWENSHGGSGSQESYLPKVVGFVKQQKKLGRLTYNVIADNNAEDMGNAWLKAAGENGIPSSFVIQKGRIAWIGHPIYLDSILTAVMAGTIDVDAIKKKNDEAAEGQARAAEQLKAAQKPYKDAEMATDYEKALRLIDTALAKKPNSNYIFVQDKLKILKEHMGDDRLIAYGRSLMNDHFLSQIVAIFFYFDKDPQSPKVQEFGIESLKNIDPKGTNYRVANFLGEYYARVGRYKEAAESEKKAAQIAAEDMKKPGFNGEVTQVDIDGFLKKAGEFQKKDDTEQ